MFVTLERLSRRVMAINLNRPTKRNALNLEAVKQLQAALKQLENDSETHAIVLAGSGGNFCAGYDLNDMIDLQSSSPKLDSIQELLWPLGSRLVGKKYVVAAIEGYAAGFGLELALRCDFRVADKNARMGFLNRRLGVPIMSGGTVILPRLIGLSQAMEVIGTGRALSAPEALQTGLLNYITDVGCARGRALNLAKCLSKFDQPTLELDLSSVYGTEAAPIQSALQLERDRALAHLRSCHTIELGGKFLRAELCRHGSFDLGSVEGTEAQVTL